MQKYRVMVNGKSFVMELEGVRQKLGFLTNVYVEAFTVTEAESRAIAIIREDTGFAEIVSHCVDGPLKMSVDEVEEIESFDGHKLPKEGFILYPV